MITFRIPTLSAIGLVLTGLAIGQGTTAATPPTPPPAPTTAAAVDAVSATAMAAAPSDFQVGAGDVLQVEVLNMPQFSRSVMVNPDGTIRLAYAPEALRVQGQTADQIAAALDAELRQRQVFVDPQLAVTVTQVRSRPIVVSGEVRNPQVIQAVQSVRLLDALVMAGGVADNSATDVLVKAPTANGQPGATEDLPLDKVLAGSGDQYDPVLQSGDIVQVLPGGRVFVAGDVKNPGAFPLTPGQPLYVSQVMALVGGWNHGASTGKTVIVRQSASGSTTTPVDLRAVMNHKAPDVALAANDLVYVPGDAKQQIGLAAAQGFGGALMLGLGYAVIH